MLNISNLQKLISGFLARSQYKVAERILGHAICKTPQDSLLRYLAFKIAFASGGDNRKHLNELLDLRQNDEFTLYRQFCALMIMGEYEKAFSKAEELSLKWVRIGVGEMLNPAGEDLGLALGNTGIRIWAEKTLKSFNKCPSRIKRTLWYIFFKAILLDSLNKEKAHNLMEGFCVTDIRRYGWMLYHLGRLRLFFGLTRKALNAFDSALKSKPGDWLVLCMRAECLASLGNYKAAYKDFKTAVCGNPHALAQIKAWEGEILLWDGRYEEALKNIDGVLLTCPRFAYSWRGIANHKLGNLKSALDDLETALNYDPHDLEALVYRAEIARLEKDYVLAERLIKRVLKENAVYFWALANLALLKFAQGKYGECVNNYKKARLRLKPLISKSLKKEERVAAAVKTLEKWFLLAKGNRRNELHCLKNWLN
ncbi:MAG: hypothetical protein A2270_00565 [Elusimicrobia bacterium RIFOXYA12_FULL_51_18]|nr:MAG: hypothetical protein A2270_00565 [Elusimicrobia bacterium RIFOXYA12_FULL_51_18]OGS28990.1 MAG: hypothetical protein A2218_08580 [Elusimicrobia bacterium RIFOXYA2_FULL_53_38]